jgi:phenylalanyl-tRNA synthetase alpha chain
MHELKTLKQKLIALNTEYKLIPTLPPNRRAAQGKSLNLKKQSLLAQIAAAEQSLAVTPATPIDITAPTDINQPIPDVATAPHGSRHPLMTELDRVIDIYNRMGFTAIESRSLDDEFHMFDSLNFPPDHPARDGYDTFRTSEGFIPPAHTSTMQHRILKQGRAQLENGGEIAVVIPGCVFRNEDVDATHEHTFYQCEGVFVSRTATLGQMLGVLRNFFETYYDQKLKIKTQPAYFPFTEPSLEFLIEKPASLTSKSTDYLEMLGCGMIHPNVLKLADIDPTKYQGFAWGGGIDRLVMLKYHLSDIRYFHSGKLNFLKSFK